MSIRARLVATYILVSIPPIFFVSYVYFNNTKEALVAAKLTELESVADLKVSIIANFFSDLRKDVAISQDYYNIRHNLPILTRNIGDAEGKAFRAATAMLDSQLGTWKQARSDVDDFMLLAPDGRVVYSVNGFYEQEKFGALRYDDARIAFTGGMSGVFIGDIFRVSEQDYDFYITAPVNDELGNFSGVIAVRMDIRKLWALVADTKGLGATGEALVGKYISASAADPKEHILILHPLRFDPSAALKRKVYLGSVEGLPPQYAYLGGDGSGRSVDYRGEDVLSAWRRVPLLNWEFAVNIDLAEALLPTRMLAASSWLLGIVIALLVFLVSWIFSRLITKPMQQLALAAEHVQAGDLEAPIAEHLMALPDETGTLARALTAMIGRVRESYQGLERKVEEKTRETTASLSELERQNKELVTAKRAVMNVLDDSRKKEGLLERERNKLEAILRGIGEGVFVIDRWEVVTFFNAAAEGISGYSASEIVGKPYQEILQFMREADEEIDLRFIDDALFGERVVQIHVSAPLLLLRKSGKSIAVAANATPLRDERGETAGVVVIFRDVSHEREIDRAKTEFISLATHQLRTPLTTMKWIPEMLLEGALGKLQSKQRRYIEDLRRSAERLIALINQLLDIARIESRRLDFKIENVVVADVFRDLRLDFAHEANLRKHHLIFRAPEPAKLRTDRCLLGEIVRNLISNAVKYTLNGGRIEIALQPFTKGFVRLSVKDNGIGIPEEQQKHLFEKFFRADNAEKIDVSGTGLGLYIIKGIAGALGGTITLESREGKGTTFFVDLPIEGPPQQT